MTFLELCQMLRQEDQVAGSGPSSVANQTGENKSLVDWVRNSWTEIQLLHPNWLWLNGSFSFTTTTEQFSYTPVQAGIAARFNSWDTRSIRIFQTSLGDSNSTPLPFHDYVMYRDYYLTNTQSPGRPVISSVSPSLSLLIGPKPNAIGYTVIGEYRKGIQPLLADGDSPEMPADYHMMIVYKALMKYARSEAAAEIYEDAKKEFDAYKFRLELNQLPPVSLAGPLA